MRADFQVSADLLALGRYTYDVHENCLIFKTPQPPVHVRPKFFHLPRPWTSNFEQLPPPTHTLSNKLWNNNLTVHVNKRNQNKIKTKSRHIRTDHAFCCSI